MAGGVRIELRREGHSDILRENLKELSQVILMTRNCLNPYVLYERNFDFSTGLASNINLQPYVKNTSILYKKS